MEKSWPGDRRHPTPLANRGEPRFPTIAYKSSSTVYMRNCKAGSGGRVTLGVGSLGWRDRVTHVNGYKRVNSPSRAKSRHAEHAHADISVTWEGQVITTWLMSFPYRRAVKLARGREGGSFLHMTAGLIHAIVSVCFYCNVRNTVYTVASLW